MNLSGVPVNFKNEEYFLRVKDDIRLVVEVSKTLEYLLRKNFVTQKLKDDATLGRVTTASNLPKPIKGMIYSQIVNPRNKIVHNIEHNCLPKLEKTKFARNATRILFDLLPRQLDINNDLVVSRTILLDPVYNHLGDQKCQSKCGHESEGSEDDSSLEFYWSKECYSQVVTELEDVFQRDTANNPYIDHVNRAVLVARQRFPQSHYDEPFGSADKGDGVVCSGILAIRAALIYIQMYFMSMSEESRTATFVLLGFLATDSIHIATSGLNGIVFASYLGGVGAGIFWKTLSSMNNIYFEMKQWWFIRIGPPTDSDCLLILEECNRRADKLYEDFSDLMEPGCYCESNKMYFGMYGDEKQLRNMMIKIYSAVSVVFVVFG